MKTRILVLVSLMILIPFISRSQDVVHAGRSLESFDALIIGGYYKVTLFYSEDSHVIIKANKSDQDKIQTEVRNGVLRITNKPLHQKKPISIEIYSDYINDYDISGAVMIESAEVQKPEYLNLDINGAAQVKLKIETGRVNVDISGAAILYLSGSAESIDTKASGAALINTSNLEAAKNRFVASGAAGVFDKEMEMNNDSDEDVDRDNEINASDKDGEKTTYGVTYDGSTARAKFLGIKVNVYEDDETGEVQVGTHKWVFDSDGEITHKRVKYARFNGHWGGFGMGINGYVNNKLSYELPEEYEFMDLLWQKSINVDINIYEQNISLSQNGNIGLVTGIGYSIYNYRFTHSFTVMQDSNYFSGLYNRDINVRKSKIVTNYIMVPVLFEIQDKNPNPLTKYRWHVNIGAIFGLRVHTHQKTYFDEQNKEFNLVNPLTGHVDATAISPSYPKAKVHDDFYMRPFKVDASLRVGWGWINLYANVSLTEMFSKNKGPKLYPFTIGIMLASW